MRNIASEITEGFRIHRNTIHKQITDHLGDKIVVCHKINRMQIYSYMQGFDFIRNRRTLSIAIWEYIQK